MPLYLIFLAIPVLEVMVFIAVGDEIGILPTLLLIILTAVIGSNIIRIQGMQTFLSARSAFARGKVPTGQLFDGLCLLVAGAFLITPGFVTDTIGFLLLVPKLRMQLREFLKSRVSWDGQWTATGPQQDAGRIRDPDAIEGEFERLDENR